MDALTLLILLIGFGSDATTSDTGDPGSGDPDRGTKPVGG